MGRYRIVRQLGEGATGVVYEAHDPELQRTIAIKLLKESIHASADARERLRKEAQALARLDHPNVVRIHDVEVQPERAFIVMECVEGQTLRQWMSHRRSWQEILEVFTSAGRGLAAAHEAGLVHRDFKPDNVMIDRRGRARVMDFGLARVEPDLSAAFEDAFTHELTHSGKVVGTPAYMSLEQLRDQQVDGLSDQFSFCVSLYEALYGQRPYRARSYRQLVELLERADFDCPLPGSSAPTWIGRILARGLASEPDRRWASMDALVAALEHTPRRRRRRWGLSLGALGLASLGFAGAWAFEESRAQTCEGAEAAVHAVWDAGRRGKAREAVLATGSSYASTTWSRVEAQLDDYAQRWVETRTQTCVDHVRGQQGDGQYALAMGCLDDRLARLDGLIGLFELADPRTVEHGAAAVLALPALDACAAPQLEEAVPAVPDDPELAKAIAELDRTFAQVEVHAQAGACERGLTLARALVEDAHELAYEPLEARAWLLRGTLEHCAGDYEGAEDSLERAYRGALSQSMQSEAAQAASKLAMLVGNALERPRDAEQWVMDADAMSRAANDARERIRYFSARGDLAHKNKEHEEAQHSYMQAQQLAERHHADDELLIASLLSRRGVDLAREEPEQAIALIEHALEIETRLLGEDHPTIASEQGRLGNIYNQRGDYEQAIVHLELALQLQRAQLGPDHPVVAMTLNNLARALSFRGERERAREYYGRSLEIKERHYGPNHPHVANTLNSLGGLEAMEDNSELAETYYRRVYEIYREHYGETHDRVGFPLANLGEVAALREDWGEARAYLERALAIWSTHEQADEDPRVIKIRARIEELEQLEREIGG